jgi:mono/diheme cytochrome c family protein
MSRFRIRDALAQLRAGRGSARRSLPLIALSLVGCGAAATHAEGLEPATLPVEQRADYAIFAQRCSKCHSLARPLNSGISDENYWSLYVARMRRQPGSGISQEDAEPILRFLHYYSVEQLRKPEKAVPPPATSSSSLDRAHLVRM